eukprot:5732969-Prorocentrum_lima.AAC.1
MTSSLVGSEMCIRDRACVALEGALYISALDTGRTNMLPPPSMRHRMFNCCLLYTSDAADDM